MGILVNCPQATALESIPVEACPESLGQIQKVIFQRIFASAGVLNKFVVATTNPNVLASWTPLLAASDSTKATPSPYISAPVAEPGAARTYGGGNETIGGIEVIIGREPTAFTGNVLTTKQNVIESMKKLMGEEIGVYLIDEHGRIAGLADDLDTVAEVFPIPLRGFFMGDKQLGGLDSVDLNAIQWKFLPNWSDKLTFVTPTDFNALTGLVNP